MKQLSLSGPRSGKGTVGRIFTHEGWTIVKPSYVIVRENRVAFVFVALWGWSESQKRSMAALNQAGAEVVTVEGAKALHESDVVSIKVVGTQDVPAAWLDGEIPAEEGGGATSPF